MVWEGKQHLVFYNIQAVFPAATSSFSQEEHCFGALLLPQTGNSRCEWNWSAIVLLTILSLKNDAGLKMGVQGIQRSLTSIVRKSRNRQNINVRMLPHLVPSTDFQPASIEQVVLKGFVLCCLFHQWNEEYVTSCGAEDINKGQNMSELL